MLMFRMLRRALSAAGLDERRCAVCRLPYAPGVCLPVASAPPERAGAALPLCPDCRSVLQPRLQGYCPRCGQLFPLASAPCAPCGDCLASPPPWRQFRLYAPYAGTLRTLLLRGKFGRDPAVLHLIGRLLAQVCADLPVPDAVVPVPLHVTRLRERGFNQSQELARPLAAALGAPLSPALLRRPQATRHQIGLNRAERRLNLHGAFTAHAAVRGKTILLVDDTLTTGTTLRRAALALLEEGALAVDVAVAARTPRDAAGQTRPPVPRRADSGL